MLKVVEVVLKVLRVVLKVKVVLKALGGRAYRLC